MDVVRLPPSYHKADEDLMRLYRQNIAEIERRARNEMQVWVDKIVEIESRYAPRFVITGLTKDDLGRWEPIE